MSMKKQTSDHMNGKKVAGTGYRTLTPVKYASGVVDSISPSGNKNSGSSQGHKRGKQGMG